MDRRASRTPSCSATKLSPKAPKASAKSAQTVVVDPYPDRRHRGILGGLWAPLSFRERIRALGPSNHPHHGKQALGGADIVALRQADGAARSTGRVNLIKRK